MDDVSFANETISFIVSATRQWVMGDGGAIPWHEPADLQRFRRLTSGKAMLMGSRTHEGIGRPLPGRPNVVVSRSKAYDGVVNCRSLEGGLLEAVRRTAPGGEVMVIGGADIFAQLLPRCGRLYLTRLDADIFGGVRFPEIDAGQWVVQHRERVADCRWPHDFEIWERK